MDVTEHNKTSITGTKPGLKLRVVLKNSIAKSKGNNTSKLLD